ncbi:MAG: BspA family leucine-rich repeat surface protein [Filifactor alocis]|nr:BspA family leucine-rich repeat surface protein [Filifactor alocis]
MKTTSSTGSRRLLALMLSLLMTFGLWTADLRGAVAHAEVTPIETINDFELDAGGTVKATWDQATQTLTVRGAGKIDNGKWKELARKFSEENFKGYDGWANNSDFTLRFESNAILLPDDTRIEDNGKFMGFFQDFDGEIKLPSDLNVSNVTNMNRMFFAIDKADPDVSRWNVSKVTDMSYMFAFSQKANPNVSAWDVSEVTDMSYTFGYVEKANPDVSAWDVSKVINMDFMFYSADEFRGVGDNVKRWRPGALRTMKRMFDRSGAEVLDLSSWGVLNIEAYGAFEGMKDLKSLKLKGLCNAGLNNFKGPYSYTKDGGAPVEIADQNENVFFDDNAEYIVTLLGGIEMKEITVKFLTPDGHVLYTESFLAAKGLSFTDRELFSKLADFEYRGFAPNTPDKVNIVGEENEITFEVPLKYASTDPSKFGVDFDEGNGRSSFVLVPKNTPVSKPEDPKRPGHTFKGWYKEDTFVTPWDFNDPVTDNMILYAKWERDPNVTFYTITVVGGTSGLATASEGELVRVKVGPIPSGQRFSGWTGDAEVVFADVTSPSTFFRMPGRNVTITANFAPVGQKVVSFDSTGGSSVPPISVAPGNPIPEPAPPTRAGYTFDGWYIDTSYNIPLR